jgi:glycerol uptake facilitator-like aquaporin
MGQAAPTLFAAADITAEALANKQWYVFFAELLGASILGLAYASATRTADRLTGAFTIGLGVFAALMITVTFSGFVAATAILNPAVALSLQAYQPDVWTYAVYALAPVIGGVLGFIVHDLVRTKEVI